MIPASLDPTIVAACALVAMAHLGRLVRRKPVLGQRQRTIVPGRWNVHLGIRRKRTTSYLAALCAHAAQVWDAHVGV